MLAILWRNKVTLYEEGVEFSYSPAYNRVLDDVTVKPTSGGVIIKGDERQFFLNVGDKKIDDELLDESSFQNVRANLLFGKGKIVRKKKTGWLLLKERKPITICLGHNYQINDTTNTVCSAFLE